MSRRRALIAGWLVILALSATIPLSALFHGLLHVGPGATTFHSVVTRPVIVVGGNVVLLNGATSIVVDIGGDVVLHGRATDDLVTADGAVYLSPGSRVEGDVVTMIGGIYRSHHVKALGRLGGAVHPWNGTPVSRHHNAVALAALNFRLGLAAGLALLLVGTCLTVVFPWQVVLIATTLRGNPLKSAAAGLTNLVIFVFLVVPLGLSLIGLPFALLLTGAAALAWLFGLTATAVVLGRSLAHDTVSLVWATAAGLIVMAISLAVPLIGPLVITALGLAGAGALAVALVSRSRPLLPAG